MLDVQYNLKNKVFSRKILLTTSNRNTEVFHKSFCLSVFSVDSLRGCGLNPVNKVRLLISYKSILKRLILLEKQLFLVSNDASCVQ